MPREPLREVTVPAGYTISDFGKGRGGGYHIDGEKVVGVTTALGIIDGGKSGAMAYSAARIWLEGVCSLVNEQADFAWDDPKGIEDALKARRLLHIHRWGDKADLGTSIHSALEQLCGDVVPTLGAYPDNERGYLKALCEFWADHDPIPVHTEIMVGSKEHGYAGRTDLIYATGSNALVMLDAKTSARVSPTFSLQLAAYKGAYSEAGYGDIDRTEVLWLKPDGYELIETNATLDQFLACLDTYRAYNEIEKAAKAA